MFLDALKNRLAQPDSLVGIALMSFVSVPFLIPIHHQPIPSFYGEWWALLLGILAMLAISRLNPPQLLVPEIASIPLILLFSTGVQWALGMVATREAMVMHSGYLVWSMLLVILGATLTRSLGCRWVFTTLAWGLLFGALSSALLALAQLMDLPLPSYLLFPWSRPEIHAGVYANIAQSNLLGSYVWLGIAASLHLHSQGLLSRRTAFLSAGVLGFVAGLTISRMSIMFGLAMLAVPLVFRQGTSVFKTRSRLIAIALLSLAAGGMVLHQWSHQSKRVASVTLLDRYAPKSVGADPRLDIWRDTSRIIGEHPWLGNGVGNYTWAMLESTAEAPAGAKTLPNAEHSHNLLLQLAADHGLPALLLCLILLARWAATIYRTDTSNKQGSFGLDVLSVLLIYSMLEYPLWYSFYLGLAALIMGACCAGTKSWEFSGSLRLIRFGLVAALLALIPVRLDFGRLDFAINTPLAKSVSEAAMNAELKQRIQVVGELGARSSIESYAGLVLTILSVPDRKVAQDQSRLCEEAMKLWPIPIIVTKCAVLRDLIGKPQESEQLLVLLDKAYRKENHKKEVEAILAQSETKNPETNRLRVFWGLLQRKTGSADTDRSK